MLDSIYHMTLKLLKNHLSIKMENFAIFNATQKWTSLCNLTKSVIH